MTSRHLPTGFNIQWPSSPYGVIGIGLDLIFGDGSPSTFKSEYAATTQRLFSEGNPVYGPGFGDTRWLRDLEPFIDDMNQNNSALTLFWAGKRRKWCRVVFDISLIGI